MIFAADSADGAGAGAGAGAVGPYEEASEVVRILTAEEQPAVAVVVAVAATVENCE